MQNKLTNSWPWSSLCLAAVLFCAAAKAQTGYDKLTLNAFYQRQDFESAIRYLQTFAGQDSGTVAYNRDLGYSLYMQEDYKAAKFYFTRLLVLAPDNVEANLYLAQVYNLQGKLDSSLYFYHLLVRSNPAQSRFWQKAGSLHYRLSEYDSAMSDYQQAYRINNRSGRVAIELSNLFIQKKQYDSADILIREFLSRDTLDEEVIAKKMDICFKKSQYDTVIFWGEKLWRDSSLLNQPFINLAYSYLNREKYATCLQLCNWLDEGNRAGQSVLYCAALALGKTKRYAESNEKLDLCIKMSILDDAHTYLATKGDNFENMKDFRKAVSYYDTAWYIFHQPFDLYFAGRIYDKFYKLPGKAATYYRQYQKNQHHPSNDSERRVMEYIDDFLNRSKKPTHP